MNNAFRQHFPFFNAEKQGIYLDSAATTLKPQVLLEATSAFYASAGSVHRSQYDLPQTEAFEQARHLVAERFNLPSAKAVIWTSGTTHAINLVANGLAEHILPDDEILISVAEHHANFIPWQQLAQRRSAKLVVLPLNHDYQLDPAILQTHLSAKTKIVALNLVSNVTGVHQPVETLIPLIRAHTSAKILLDIAQAVCYEKLDLTALDADFYAFSAHKMYGPTGVGVLTGKIASLEQLQPIFFGGKMLADITPEKLTLADLPYRLEAGTPNIAGIIGFGQVLTWLKMWDFHALNTALNSLTTQLRKRLNLVNNLHLLAENSQHPTISFTIKGHHPADIASILAEMGVAVRVGEHCAKPFLRYLAQTGTLRISLGHYNNLEDIEGFLQALETALSILSD
ncbi:cysteine desulfurase [Pasteurellaceae bacterium Macca]|nr:cysteine desulfurase [Pasteurellaceae bacterium Macca]